MKYEINKHSSIRIAAEKIIYFDPFEIEKEAHDADVIFITHEHFDHMSPADMRKAAGENTRFVFPESCRNEAEKEGFSGKRSLFLKPGEQILMGEMNVAAVPAYNVEKPFHPKENAWLGYVITLEGKRIYVMGDTDAHPDAQKIQAEICFIPVGGKYTMNYEAAAEYVNGMGFQKVIPTHYGSVVGKKEHGRLFKEKVKAGTEVEIII